MKVTPALAHGAAVSQSLERDWHTEPLHLSIWNETREGGKLSGRGYLYVREVMHTEAVQTAVQAASNFSGCVSADV